MSIKIVNTEGGTDFSPLIPAILVNTNGEYLDISPSGSTYGDVDGPTSSTDDAVVLFDGATGKKIKNSNLTYISNNLQSAANLGLYAASGQMSVGSNNSATTIRAYTNININAGYVSPSGNINLTTPNGYISVNGPIVPDGSGTRSVGTSDMPFANVWTKQINSSVLAGMSPVTVLNDLIPSGTVNLGASGNAYEDIWVNNIKGAVVTVISGSLVGQTPLTVSSGTVSIDEDYFVVNGGQAGTVAIQSTDDAVNITAENAALFVVNSGNLFLTSSAGPITAQGQTIDISDGSINNISMDGAAGISITTPTQGNNVFTMASGNIMLQDGVYGSVLWFNNTGAVLNDGLNTNNVTMNNTGVTINSPTSSVNVGPTVTLSAGDTYVNLASGNSLQLTDIKLSDTGLTSLVAGKEIAISASSGVAVNGGSAGEINLTCGQDIELNSGKQIIIGCSDGITLNSTSGVTCGAFVSSPVYKTTVQSNTASSGVTVIDWTQGASQHLNFASAPSGVATLEFNGASAGSSYVLKTIQNNTADLTVAWSGNFLWRGGSVGAFTVASGATDIFTFYYDGTNYLGNAGNDYK